MPVCFQKIDKRGNVEELYVVTEDDFVGVDPKTHSKLMSKNNKGVRDAVYDEAFGFIFTNLFDGECICDKSIAPYEKTYYFMYFRWLWIS